MQDFGGEREEGEAQATQILKCTLLKNVLKNVLKKKAQKKIKQN